MLSFVTQRIACKSHPLSSLLTIRAIKSTDLPVLRPDIAPGRHTYPASSSRVILVLPDDRS